MKNAEMLVKRGYNLKDLDIELKKTELTGETHYDSFDITLKKTPISRIRTKRPDDVSDTADFVDYADRQLLKWLDAETGSAPSKAEKRYLKSYTGPFRDRIGCIVKVGNDENETLLVQIDGYTSMPFPSFKSGTMYRGLQRGRNTGKRN